MSSPPPLLLDLHQTSLPLSGKIDFLPPLLLSCFSSLFSSQVPFEACSSTLKSSSARQGRKENSQATTGCSHIQLPTPNSSHQDSSLISVICGHTGACSGFNFFLSRFFFFTHPHLPNPLLPLLFFLHLILFLQRFHQYSHLHPTPLLSEPSLGSMHH